MDDTVLKLLEELEQVVDEGRSSPFSNKVQVDKDEIFEIIDEIKERFDNSLGAFLQFIAEQRTKLAAIAENVQLKDNPTNLPPQPKNTDSADQLGEQYQAAILRQQQELNEQTVAAMQEGADKERAQIRLEYEKKRQQYEDEERNILSLIKKLRASGADIDPGAEKRAMALSSASITSRPDGRMRRRSSATAKKARLNSTIKRWRNLTCSSPACKRKGSM